MQVIYCCSPCNLAKITVRKLLVILLSTKLKEVARLTLVDLYTLLIEVVSFETFICFRMRGTESQYALSTL